jgi:carboxypeptidase C (cathepsin A)
MKISLILRLALALVLANPFSVALAQNKSSPTAPSPAAHREAASHEEKRPSPSPGKGLLRLLPADSITEHSIDTPKGKLAYTATAGTLALYDQSGEQSASIFYTAYVAKNARPNRPITFVFNGGPGAASAFLHLGLVGPRILDFGPDGHDLTQKQLQDNPNTWLNFSDLVFIDPIGTGWSRAAKADEAKNFWNVESDAESMAKTIALYVSKNNRTSSPKYLLGESYGGFRAAKTARTLQKSQGIIIDGIVMLSPLLEGWLTFADDQSALRAALELPSLAASELERKNAFTPEALGKAERFAMTDYLTTLAGSAPQGEAAHNFYARVAEISGLPLDAVVKQRGFVTDNYVKTLRPRQIVSRYDATFAVDDPFPERRNPHGPDPVLDGVARAYGGAFAAYARHELGFETEITYALLSNEVTRQWDWKGGRVQAGVAEDLGVLLSFDRSFRLLIANGYSDLVTPYATSRYVLDHLPPSDPPGRAQLKLYRGGHMFYIDRQSRSAFSADAMKFYGKLD